MRDRTPAPPPALVRRRPECMSLVILKFFTRGIGEGKGFLWGQRTTSFSHVPGDAFQIFCCISFEALFIIGVHAVARPVVAVEVFRGSALATSGTLTITTAQVPLAEL